MNERKREERARERISQPSRTTSRASIDVHVDARRVPSKVFQGRRPIECRINVRGGRDLLPLLFVLPLLIRRQRC